MIRSNDSRPDDRSGISRGGEHARPDSPGSGAHRSGEREQADAPGSDSPRSGERERADATHKGYLRRLSPEHYRGHAFVHWTLTIEQRQTGWLNERFHHHWREALLHTMGRYYLCTPTYALMPDHIHVILLGVAPQSDQRVAVEFLRRHLASKLAPAVWQKQAHDHVLTETEREQNAFQRVAAYIQQNPVRAGLVDEWRSYPFIGCCALGFPDLSPTYEGYWDTFWRIYNRAIEANAAGASARSRSPLQL